MITENINVGAGINIGSTKFIGLIQLQEGYWFAVKEGEPEPSKVYLINENNIATIPDSVTPRQIRMALNAAGLRPAIDEVVAGASQDVKDTWEYSTEFHRDNQLLNQFANIVGLTKEQVDELFISASKL